MNSNIFNTFSDSFQISHILFAGPVIEIPAEKRKSESTHSFKIITTQGAVYCYFKNIETAKKARGALEGMMESAKPGLFKYANETLDTSAVVSFGNVVKLKNSDRGMTHAFVVTLNTSNEKNNQLWFTYKSEDTAKHARNALWAKIESSGKIPSSQTEENAESLVAECSAEM